MKSTRTMGTGRDHSHPPNHEGTAETGYLAVFLLDLKTIRGLEVTEARVLDGRSCRSGQA